MRTFEYNRRAPVADNHAQMSALTNAAVPKLTLDETIKVVGREATSTREPALTLLVVALEPAHWKRSDPGIDLMREPRDPTTTDFA